jgi:AraC-like DNA-binding protein
MGERDMRVDIDDDERIYPVVKLATLLDALEAEGTLVDNAIGALGLSRAEISLPATRISLNQLLEVCRYADKTSRDRFFAFKAGLRLHVPAYGMYGFAILSSMDYRRTMSFAMTYHQLATPLGDIEFREQNGLGVWRFEPRPIVRHNPRLCRFVVEMQFGIIVSLLRDIMGPAFKPREFRFASGQPEDAGRYPEILGAPALFEQSENAVPFDAAWLDGKTHVGNDITYKAVVELCDSMLEEFELRAGIAGRVRQRLMLNLTRPGGLDEIAEALNMSARTLRRKLREENTSFRNVVDEMRKELAIRYLRDTQLTIEDIADLMGFSDAANFRHAFRRWTNATPRVFRRNLG